MKELSEYSLQERRSPEFHDKLREMNLLFVRGMIASTVTQDTFISQSVNSIEELDKVINVLVKRLREWYGYYFPELSHQIEDNEVYVKRLLQKSKKEFMEEYSIKVSMGPDIEDKDLDAITLFARQISDLFLQREKILSYLDDAMKKQCPNVTHLIGAVIGAKLIEKSGSLRQLAMLPSSTIQLLGAEQALFRHLRNKRIRPPKHGFILSHPFVMNAQKKDRGRTARLLAAKICICAKVDYFKGEFIADKIKEQLDKKSGR